MRRLHTGRFRDLEPIFAASAREAGAADPWAPVLVLVPSNAVRERLSEVLVPDGGALLGTRFLTLLDLAREAAGEDHPPVLSFAERDLLLRVVIEASFPPGSPGPVRTPGFRRSAGATVRDLKEAGIPPEEFRRWAATGGRKGNRRLETVARIFAGYEEALRERGLADREDLLASAAGRAGNCRTVSGAARVLLYGFYDFSPLQRNLLDAVLRAPEVEAFVPVPTGPGGSPAAESGLYAAETLRWLSDPSRLGAPLPAPAGAAPPPAVEVFEAAGPAREAEEAVRRVLGFRESGVPFHRIAILHRDPEAIRLPLCRALEEAAIPFRFASPRPLGEHPAGVAACALLRALRHRLPWEEVTAFLLSPYGKGDSARRLDRVVKEHGIDGGGSTLRGAARRWREEFGRAVGRAVREERRTAEDPGETEEGRERARARAAELRGLEGEVLGPLLREAESLPGRAAPAEWAAAVSGALGRLLRLPPEPGGPLAGEEDALLSVSEAVAELAGLGRIVPEMTADEFLDAALEAVAESPFRAREPRADQVRVMDVMGARGLRFDAVVLLGMNEKVFPRSAREDVFLRDDERRRLAGATGRGPAEKSASSLEERLLFSLALESGERHVVLGRQRSDASGRVLVGSWYLGLVHRELGLPSAPAPRGTAISRFREAQREPGLRLPVEARVLSLRRAFGNDVPGGRGSPAWLAAAESLHRGLLAEEGRGDWDRLTGWDGMAGAPAGHSLAGRRLSITRVETYNLCPFRYWAAHVLRLEPPPAHRSLEEIEPLDRGTIFHDAMKEGYARLLDRGLLPAREPAAGEIVAILESAWEERFAEFPFAGLPLFAEIERSAARGAIGRLVEWEIGNPGWTPVALEAWFEGLEVALPAGPVLRFAGRIDRVDRDGKGNARVADYKSGKGPGGKTAKVGEGIHMQPALYAWAVEAGVVRIGEAATLPSLPVTGSFYLHPYREEGPIERRADAVGEAGKAAILPVLAAAARRMEEGVFHLRPGGHCDWCDFSKICRKDPRRRAEAKLERSPYREIRDPGTPGEPPAPAPAGRNPRRGGKKP